MFEYQQQLFSIIQVEDVNRLIQLLYRFIEIDEFKDIWLLSYMHLLKILLRSNELASDEIMRSIYASVHFIHSEHTQKNGVLAVSNMEVECIVDVLKTWNTLQADITAHRINNSTPVYISLFLKTLLLSLDMIHSTAKLNSKKTYSMFHHAIDLETRLQNLSISLHQMLLKAKLYPLNAITESLHNCLLVCYQCIREFVNSDHSRRKMTELSIFSILTRQLNLLSEHDDNGNDNDHSDLIWQVIYHNLRIASRLSLMETFRSQVNHNKELLQNYTCILQILQHSFSKTNFGAQLSSASIQDRYFMPILSLTAFILGNLTTSNKKNRRLLGYDCQLISPLLCLLEVSI